ncbi:MAG TPA: hypothetical protein VI588_01215 [Candidatus Gracilibacteria bacterium]|nr:hypothetical protein [Candidatus Gracilibacteria bacterium]
MKPVISVTAFLLLLEYQVFFSSGPYSLITAAGLVFLCAWLFFGGDQKSALSSDGKENKALKTHEAVAACVYGAVLVLSFFVQPEFALHLAIILVSAILVVGGLSVMEGREKKSSPEAPSRMSSYTVPAIYLCVMNYLLSALIPLTTGYQSILLLSCVILYDLLSKGEKMAAQVKEKKIDPEEAKHALFHSWSKYWNFFLGVWYIISLSVMGNISADQKHFLLFLFLSFLFIVSLRNLVTLKFRTLTGIIFFAAVLTGIDIVAAALWGRNISIFVQSMLIFVGFDIGDFLFHQRHYHELSPQVLLQKCAVYVLLCFYVVQLHYMMTSPFMRIDQAFTAIYNSEKQGYVSTFSAGEDPGATVDVADPENAFRER